MPTDSILSRYIAFLYWDPSREMFPFPIPILNRSILWYGFFFALGFFLAYFVLVRQFRREKGKIAEKATFLTERIALYVAIGAVLGARIGDVLFYQSWNDYVQDPLSILRIWEPGLSSHGAVAGILISLWVFSYRYRKQFPTLTWMATLDRVSVVAPLTSACIRMGNFFNQEILGKVTDVPWAIVFGHPANGSMPAPRHPVQLYESIGYLALFGLYYYLWKNRPSIHKTGKMTGLLLITLFAFRFLMEFFKEEQSVYLSGTSLLTMGQWLSIPFILLGCYLFFRKQ